MKKNIFLSILTLLLLLSCSGEKTASEQYSGTTVRLTYWCASNPREIELAKELVKKWNDAHPEVFVHLQPIPASQSSEEVLLAAIAGGTTPDICSNMWPGAMDDFTSSGGLVKLNSFPDFMDYITARVPIDLLESFKAPDGHFYQIPWKTNPTMILYNVKMFKDAGVNPPLKTYSEYLNAADLLTKDLDGDGNFDQWMAYRNIKSIWWQRLFDYYPFYIAASGGKTLFDGSEICFNNDASVKTLALFQTIYSKGYFPITSLQGDHFLAGKLATQITGPWTVAYFDKFKSDDLEYDVMPLPAPDDYTGQVYTYGDHKNISIFSNTKYPKESWEFAKTLISAQSDLRLLEICNQIPTRKSLISDSLYIEYFKSNPKIAVFAKQAPFTRGVDGVSDLKEIIDGISQEYEACAIYGKITPQEAVNNAAKRAKVIMDWNRSR
jgi:multiple sugar transport system substrate-binding protein